MNKERNANLKKLSDNQNITHFVMLNLFQHLIKSRCFEILKRVQDDKKQVVEQPIKVCPTWLFDKKIWYIIAILILFINTTLFAKDEPVTIKASVDKSKITIGDRFNYKVIIEAKKGLSVTLPDIPSTLTSFEIKDYRIDGPKKKWSKVVTKHSYLLTTFTTGEYKIPALTVEYTDKDGVKKEIKSPEISIFVESVQHTASDTDDIRDIKSPLSIKGKGLLYATIAILLLIISFVGWNLYQKSLMNKAFWQKTEPTKPAHELAYERFDKLRKMQLIESGKTKEHYIMLSEIIRRYIEDRYNISVLDRTTAELFMEMKKADIDKKHCSFIKEFMDECDLVKFAKYTPEIRKTEEDFSIAQKIVDITKKVVEETVKKTV
ncbi:MAG: BatD family protein [Candidatus Firestonebacteria bacterium]